jgi:hypothetical protein
MTEVIEDIIVVVIVVVRWQIISDRREIWSVCVSPWRHGAEWLIDSRLVWFVGRRCLCHTIGSAMERTRVGGRIRIVRILVSCRSVDLRRYWRCYNQHKHAYHNDMHYPIEEK